MMFRCCENFDYSTAKFFSQCNIFSLRIADYNVIVSTEIFIKDFTFGSERLTCSGHAENQSAVVYQIISV